MAPQLIEMKGPLARSDRLCSSRATSSFPVPVSPRIRVVRSVGAIRRMTLKIPFMEPDEPII